MAPIKIAPYKDSKNDLQEMDSVSRSCYAEEFNHRRIAAQLRTIRESRAMTREYLAQASGVSELTIKEYERVTNCLSLDYSVLSRIARVLGVRLHVSLETFGSLIQGLDDLTAPEKLWRPTFEDDPVFTGKPAFPPGPKGEMQRKLIPWLMDSRIGSNDQPLLEWLQGYDLPPVGDEMAPSEWLLYALEGQPAFLRDILIERAYRVFSGLHRISVKRQNILSENLQRLLAASKA